MNYSIIFLLFISFAVAQQQGGWDNPNYQDYERNNNYNDNNIYANYAARQQEKAVGVGWPKLLMASVGGYIFGSKFHSKKNQGPKLRFKVKQRVECNMMGGRWQKGRIVKLWYQIDVGQWVPYQVRLDDGSLIYAPADHDASIRAIANK